jgi:hypothetical protein
MIPPWLHELLDEISVKAEEIMKTHKLDSVVVEHLATTLSFEEFNEALDILLAKNGR